MDCRHIQFPLDKSNIHYQQLQMLFNQAAFWARERTIKDLNTAVSNSNPVVTVWDGKIIIGFCRGTSDGVYRATIWDVVIHKEVSRNCIKSPFDESSRKGLFNDNLSTKILRKNRLSRKSIHHNGSPKCL